MNPDRQKKMSGSENLPVRDNLLVAAEAALVFIPKVGSLLSLLLDKYAPTTLQAQRDELLAGLQEDLERLKRKISDERLRSRAFNIMLVRVLRDAVVEPAKEKQAAFRAILLNEAVASFPNPEVDLFIKISEDLTAEHIQVLRVLSDTRQVFEENPRVSETIRAATSMNRVKPGPNDLVSLLLRPALPHIPEDHWKVLLSGLARYGLIGDLGESLGGWEQQMDPNHILGKLTTTLGDRYIESITFRG